RTFLSASPVPHSTARSPTVAQPRPPDPPPLIPPKAAQRAPPRRGDVRHEWVSVVRAELSAATAFSFLRRSPLIFRVREKSVSPGTLNASPKRRKFDARSGFGGGGRAVG